MSERLPPLHEQQASKITEERYLKVLPEMEDQIPTRYGGTPMGPWSDIVSRWDVTDFSEDDAKDR